MWLDDDKMLPKIVNCISRKVILTMQYCKTVRELWTLLHTWFSGASNLNRLYNLLQEVHRRSQKGRSTMDYYYDFMRVNEDFTAAMPIFANVEEMKAQREKLMMFSWLLGLEKEYDMVRSQLLSSKDLGLCLIEFDYN